jgi:release factor glutamine methyltransferase
LKETQVEIVVRDGVYPPSDDSFLLIDSINITPDDVVIEVGCGSGIVSLHAAMKAKQVVMVDVSLKAIRNSRENVINNNLSHKCSLVQTSLLSSFQDPLVPTIIIFNPPYLPEDNQSSEMDVATVGGRRGHELTIQLIEQLDSFQGTLYLVQSSLGEPDEIKSKLVEKGFEIKTVSKKRMFFEELEIVQGIRGPKESVL